MFMICNVSLLLYPTQTLHNRWRQTMFSKGRLCRFELSSAQVCGAMIFQCHTPAPAKGQVTSSKDRLPLFELSSAHAEQLHCTSECITHQLSITASARSCLPKVGLPFFELPSAQGRGAIMTWYRTPATAERQCQVMSFKGRLPFLSCLQPKGAEQLCRGTILQRSWRCGHRL
ncbi:hypothetical protein EV702DRAFT_1061327 [Suillus placidus]|uniref:Uncharacterized protein n=1 Tax=Suillus placidus TaxID=48579 RepID=A0A9P7D7Q7_9AGAM|nr:hypothetical protein EV702DRAFT_1061327 [Suillus placidus]